MHPRRLTALLTGALALAACAHDATADDPTARGVLPWPRAWHAPPPHGVPAGQDDTASARHRWGVPEVSPPSAADCRRPPALHEVPGASGRQDERRLGAAPMRDSAESVARADRDAAPIAPPAAPATGARAEASAAHDAARHAPQGLPAPRPPLAATVSAGMVDDNADFGEYLSFLQRHRHVELHRRDVRERYRVEVRDALDRPVPDAELALAWRGGSVVWARADAGGSAWLHPRALLGPEADGESLEVQVRAPGARGGVQYARAALQRGQKHGVVLRLPRAADVARPTLDLVFLVDATGSMGDEIAKLKASMRSIAEQIAQLPGRPDLCLGLVAYRDRTDAFLTRRHDLTDRLGDFQHALAQLQAHHGGDYPEALNEALAEAVHGVSWRGAGTTRLVVLVGDAPPHLDYGGPQYDETIAAALARGIKLHAVGASGLDAQGESVFRQMAQWSGGRFVFLTYRDARHPGSGPGPETVHDVRHYSVDTLDRLIVRLVRDELARRPS